MTVPGHWVFAYGSNMRLVELGAWFAAAECPLQLYTAETAVLYEHRLVWNYHSRTRRGGAANVEFSHGSQVWGAALFVSYPSLHGFDVKENHPYNYRRQQRPICLGRGRWVSAWTYFVTRKRQRPHFVPPTKDYHSLLLQGARDFDLPQWYQRQLATIRSH